MGQDRSSSACSVSPRSFGLLHFPPVEPSAAARGSGPLCGKFGVCDRLVVSFPAFLPLSRHEDREKFAPNSGKSKGNLLNGCYLNGKLAASAPESHVESAFSLSLFLLAALYLMSKR